MSRTSRSVHPQVGAKTCPSWSTTCSTWPRSRRARSMCGRAEFAVQSLFGALRGMLRPLLASDRVALVFEDGDDIPALATDEGKVSQILRNFISNALKFTEKGEVRCQRRSRRDPIRSLSASATPASASLPRTMTRSSRNSRRSKTRCSTSSRAPASACRCRSGWRSCWADKSGSKARLGLGQNFRSSCPGSIKRRRVSRMR